MEGVAIFVISETALQHISLFLRSETQWEVHEPAPDIGRHNYVILFFEA